MSSAATLPTSLRFASRIEHWQRLILLNLAGSCQLDAHLSHTIVCHAENASIRTALIEACLDRIDTDPMRSRADAEETPFSVSRLLSMGQSAPVPLVLEMARLRQAFYRRLRMLARRAQEARIARVCDEVYREESEFVQILRARLSLAPEPLRITLSPRAASPLDALLARHASVAQGSMDLRMEPASPRRPGLPQ